MSMDTPFEEKKIIIDRAYSITTPLPIYFVGPRNGFLSTKSLNGPSWRFARKSHSPADIPRAQLFLLDVLGSIVAHESVPVWAQWLELVHITGDTK
jgi:hypothetical protein